MVVRKTRWIRLSLRQRWTACGPGWMQQQRLRTRPPQQVSINCKAAKLGSPKCLIGQLSCHISVAWLWGSLAAVLKTSRGCAWTGSC